MTYIIKKEFIGTVITQRVNGRQITLDTRNPLSQDELASLYSIDEFKQFIATVNVIRFYGIDPKCEELPNEKKERRNKGITE